MKAKSITFILAMLVVLNTTFAAMQEPPLVLLEEDESEAATQPQQQPTQPIWAPTITSTQTTPAPTDNSLQVVEEETLQFVSEEDNAAAKAAEQARLAEEARKAEEARLAEEARKAEAARLAEEARKAEEARLAEEARKAEEARLAEEARKAEEARLAEEARKAEEARLAEEARKAEEARLAEEARKAEEARLAEEARKAEEARLAEEARKAEEARLAEEARKAEEARLAEEARKAEEARLAEEAMAQPTETEVAAPALAPAMPQEPDTVAPALAPAMPQEPDTVAPALAPAMPQEPDTVAPALAPAMPQEPDTVAPAPAPAMPQEPDSTSTDEQKISERIAAAEAAEARALEAAAKAEQAAKVAAEERAKIEALRTQQSMPTTAGQTIIYLTQPQGQPQMQVQPQMQGQTQPQVVYVNPTATNAQQAVGQVPVMTTTAPIQEEKAVPEKLPLLQRYYKKSGTNHLSIVSVGYSTFFLLPNNPQGLPITEYTAKRHIINFEVFEWRAKLFGMQLFNFEIGVNSETKTQSGQQLTTYMHGGPDIDGDGFGNKLKNAEYGAREMWFAYKPAIKIYIPCTDWLAVQLYGGVSVDLTNMWSKISPKYYENSKIPEQNFFFGAFGGLGLMFTPLPAIPIELKAEYRHHVNGNPDIIPQGVYLSAQIHLGAPIRPKKK